MSFFDRYREYSDQASEFISTLPEIQRSTVNKMLIQIAMLILSRRMTDDVCYDAADYLIDRYLVNTEDRDALYRDILRYCYIVSPDLMHRDQDRGDF